MRAYSLRSNACVHDYDGQHGQDAGEVALLSSTNDQKAVS
jgi:hypothetical protein